MQAIETMIDAELRDVGIKIRSGIFRANNKLLFSKLACNIGKRWEVILIQTEMKTRKERFLKGP
jgi:hypothetical protein